MSEIAAALLRARTSRPRAPLEDLGPSHPRTLADGIAAQHALAALLGATPPAGFKIGATAKVMQAYLGLDGAAAGFMTEQNLHGDGSTLAWESFYRPGVECEIAALLGTDLPPGSPADARAATAALLPAIELVENRYTDLARVGAPALIADQVFHAAAILGAPCQAWQEIDLLALQGTIAVDGHRRGQGYGRDLLGGPFEALAWLSASAEAAAFGGLRAGQLVMLGSVCTPVWLDRPGRIEVSFGPLGTARLDLLSTAPNPSLT